jgi:serine/threonine protein kinase
MTENDTLVAAKIDWASLSGVILDGGCELKEALEVREDSAKLRVRILGSGGQMGSAYFLSLPPKDADDQLDIWETLREVQHPNLSRPLAVGKRQVSGVETVYLVLPDPDEKLAAVVPERPLEWEEAAEVLQSLEKGLAHLHAYGLMHGSVSPETVQAVGYTIQLSTESVRRLGTKPRFEWVKPRYLAPESRGANVTTASDVWCLGATLFEVLAQEPYGSPGAELERGLPLAAVIARCLDKDPVTRCALKEDRAFAEEPSAQPPAPPEVKPEVPEVKVEAKAEEKPAAAPMEPPAAPVLEEPTPTSKPVDNRAPGAATVRPTSASRLPQPLTPHPLTPRPAARQVTKEDMALVPMGKRHKKVQGKRLPVDARIRTLDGPTREGGEERVIALPGVAARTLGVGAKSNLVRGIVAVACLMALFSAAIWFIIIPKLQSSAAEPVGSTESAQTATPGSSPVPIPKGSEMTTSIPIPPPAANPGLDEPAADKRSASSAAATDSLALTEADSPRQHPQQFRVVLSSSDSQQDAVRRLLALNQEHPDLLLHVLPPRPGSPNPRYLVVAGGLLTRSEADQLRQRIVGKGVQTARVERLRE